MNKEIIELAIKYIKEFNLNVLPTKAKEKSPAAGEGWKEFQTRKLTEAEIEDKFKNVDLEVFRIGVVCGAVSGNLEVLDFDNKLGNAGQVYQEFLDLPEVSGIVQKCPVEKTQNGGFHVYYRCPDTEGNKKLASCPNGQDEKGNLKYECLIETRGEGGFCVCAPSKGYELIQGDFVNIPVITPEEREVLISSARSFDRKPQKVTSGFKDSKKYSEKPWELYDESEQALDDCKSLLIERGWSLQYTKGDEEYWTRPGKTMGVSATFRGNMFYVFSSSAHPFESERGYRPSGIYAVLKYGTDSGSFKKAVKDFVKMGFGTSTAKSSSTDIAQVEGYLSSKYDFRINVVTSKLEIKKKSENGYRDAEDYDLSSIHRDLQHMEIDYSYDRLNNLLNSDYVTKYDPISEYFEGLPEWDGKTDHIMELSRTIELTDEGKRDYWYKSLKRFLIALSACATNPKVTNEAAITFFGKQGLGKTKWLNRLNPKSLGDKYLFVGNINDDKDSKLNLSTKLIINLDELGSLHKEEIGYLKSLFSIDQISLREPYQRKSRAYIRRASFVGSIDREEFLTDLSGTRRFLAFSVNRIDYLHQVDMDQVYSQAYTLFKQGERFYFDHADIAEIEANNEDFRLQSFEEGLLFKFFSKPTKLSSAEALTTTEIANEFALNSVSYKVTNNSLKIVGQILTRHGFERKTVKRGGVPVKCWFVERKKNKGFSLAEPKLENDALEEDKENFELW